jgi:uncharacterized membrane protein YtjA (UPF0391 family)
VNEQRRLWCEDRTTLNWAVTFFVIALIAVLLGFGGLTGMSANVGWMLAVPGLWDSPSGVLGRAIGGGGRNALP